MEESYKEVYFGEYCKTCAHELLPEGKDPCHECLNNPVNVYSHKPVCWKEKEANEKRRPHRPTQENGPKRSI